MGFEASGWANEIYSNIINIALVGARTEQSSASVILRCVHTAATPRGPAVPPFPVRVLPITYATYRMPLSSAHVGYITCPFKGSNS